MTTFTYCPKCGGHHLFINISASLDVEFEDGNEDCQINFADDYGWDELSHTSGAACDYTDTLSSFRQVRPWKVPQFGWNQTTVLQAITARFAGAFDDPALMAFGPLSTDIGLDIQRIAGRLNK